MCVRERGRGDANTPSDARDGEGARGGERADGALERVGEGVVVEAHRGGVERADGRLHVAHDRERVVAVERDELRARAKAQRLAQRRRQVRRRERPRGRDAHKALGQRVRRAQQRARRAADRAERPRHRREEVDDGLARRVRAVRPPLLRAKAVHRLPHAVRPRERLVLLAEDKETVRLQSVHSCQQPRVGFKRKRGEKDKEKQG